MGMKSLVVHLAGALPARVKDLEGSHHGRLACEVGLSGVSVHRAVVAMGGRSLGKVASSFERLGRACGVDITSASFTQPGLGAYLFHDANAHVVGGIGVFQKGSAAHATIDVWMEGTPVSDAAFRSALKLWAVNLRRTALALNRQDPAMSL